MSRDELLQALREKREENGREEWTVGTHCFMLRVRNQSRIVRECPAQIMTITQVLLWNLMNMKITCFFCSVYPGAELEPDEFMNSKKSHEVQSMSEVVACLAQRCGVKQVE